MQTVAEVMTRNVQFVSPQESLQRAAQLMDELNIGALPVVNGEQLVGMVTDRDIAIRGCAAGRVPQEARVDEVMSPNVRWCFEDQPLDEVLIQMADSQVRRVPVVSHDEQHRLVGIVSLGDVAIKTEESQKRDVEDVVEMVSAPSTNPGGIVGQVEDVAGRTGEGGGADAGTAGGADAGGTDDSTRPTTAGDAMGGAGNADTLMAAGVGTGGAAGSDMLSADGIDAGAAGSDDTGVSGNAETLLDGAADADADTDLLTSGGEGAGAAGGDDNGAGGIDLPLAGESGIGAVGAPGQPPDGQQDGQAGPGDEAEVRARSVMSGQNLPADGQPPAV